RRNLVPQFWKIEGTASKEGARLVDEAVAGHPQGRQILLGKAANMETIERWFEVAAGEPTAAGFAIGRSVFWEPSAAFLSGTMTGAAASSRIADAYLRLVEAWKRATVAER